jgi:hypothetical protein
MAENVKVREAPKGSTRMALVCAYLSMKTTTRPGSAGDPPIGPHDYDWSPTRTDWTGTVAQRCSQRLSMRSTLTDHRTGCERIAWCHPLHDRSCEVSVTDHSRERWPECPNRPTDGDGRSVG